MLQKKYIGLALLLLAAATSFAQKAERDFIRKGNRLFICQCRSELSQGIGGKSSVHRFYV